jgi:hypothetical protein
VHDYELKRLIDLAIDMKPERHYIGCKDGAQFLNRKPISTIGG